jgi:hypothetical protein
VNTHYEIENTVSLYCFKKADQKPVREKRGGWYSDNKNLWASLLFPAPQVTIPEWTASVIYKS